MIEIGTWFSPVKDLVPLFTIVVGGIWTGWKFAIFRGKYAKIELTLDIEFVGQINETHIIELIASIQNKGDVRQQIKKFTFDFFYLCEGDDIDISQANINFQVKFKKAISKRSWIPNRWNYTFVDGGTSQKYTYLTVVPPSARLLLVTSRFLYPGSVDFHSAQKAFAIPLLKANN